MTGRARVRRWVTAASLACLLTAACGGPPAGSGGPVRGEIVAQSDVEGIPDLAGDGGFVAAVPAAREAGLWAAAGDTPRADQVPYAQFLLDRSGFESAGATVADVDDDGRFALDVPPGAYLLCRVVPTSSGELAGVRGCAPVQLPADGVLHLTTGEGGLRAAVED